MIHFKILNEGWIQHGEYEVAKTRKQGFHNTQGVELVLGSRPELPMPNNFIKTWAQFMTPEDGKSVGFDQGAYGVGTSTYGTTVKVPMIAKVTLVYMYNTDGARPSRDLMVFWGAPSEFVDRSGQRIDGRMWTNDEYNAEFNVKQGFERFGKLLPRGLAKSTINELAVIQGDFITWDTESDGTPKVDANGVLVEKVERNQVVYMQDLYVFNRMPMFDVVYVNNEAGLQWKRDPVTGGFERDANGDLIAINPAHDTMQPNRLVRWRGGFGSEKAAFINFMDDTGIDHAMRQQNSPTGVVRLDENITVDGVTYRNADGYNLTNTKR